MICCVSTSETPAHSPRRGFLLEAIVFTVGLGTLGAEIAAARLLAPWFGASTVVWANTIATVLVALSIGYALGGRWADRDPSIGGLSQIVLIASALLAGVPFVSDPFLRASVTAFDKLSLSTFVGSLVGVTVLVAVPLLLLGMVSPYAVRLKLDRVADTGKTAGRLSAIATVGSLVGTFSAALLLIPMVGTRRTFLIYALLLTLVALPGLRRRWVAVIVAVAIGALIALPAGTLKASSASQVIHEQETEYQYARVLQDSAGVRTLELNEGLAIHSIYRPGSYLTGMYYDSLLSLPYASDGFSRPDPKVAVLGNAAGTLARGIGHYVPQAQISGVEIDPVVTEIGRKYFDMSTPHLTTYADDARPWLRKHTERQDVIVIDAYRQPYIPFYLTTVEFFSLVKSRLAPGGVVAVNVGHPVDSPDLEKTLAATMRSVFGDEQVYRDPAEPTNTMLLGTTSAANPAAQLRGCNAPTELKPVVAETAARLQPALRGGRPYTDDVAPVEWLVDLSLADVASTAER